MSSTLNNILPVVYFALVWTYGKAFFADKLWAKQAKTPLLLCTIVLHSFSLAVRVIEFRHPPVTSVFEILSVLACSISIIYLAIEYHSRQKETGYFILNIAFFFQLASSLFIRSTSEVPEILRSPLFGVHVTSALLGYAASTIAGAFSLMYLMLYHEMKATQFGVIYKKLPTLETLERMTFTTVILAFVLLSIAILFGFIWLNRVIPEPDYFDPKLVGTMVMWAMYGFLVVAKARYGWKGRKVMILSIAGFLISLFSMTFINIFFSKFHKFY